MGKKTMNDVRDDIKKMFGKTLPSPKVLEEYINENFMSEGRWIRFDENGEILEGHDYVIENIYAKEASKEFFRRFTGEKKTKEIKRDARVELVIKGETLEPHFIACRRKGMLKIIDQLSIQTATHLMVLLGHLTIRSNGTLVNERGEEMNQKDIQELLGVSKRKTIDLLKELEEIKILKSVPKGRTKTYQINKKIHSMGKDINEAFVKLYKKKLNELAKEYDLGIGLGILYKMLPYVHWQTLYICWNPDEDIRFDSSLSLVDNLDFDETINAVDHMMQKDIATVVGVSTRTMRRYINVFVEMGILKTNGKEWESYTHQMHPDFVSRQDILNDGGFAKMLRFQFKQDQRMKKMIEKEKQNNKKKK